MIKKDNKNRILILDFGSQYTQILARRVRELEIYCEIYLWNTTIEKILNFSPNGIILSGGPKSATDKNYPSVDDKIFHINIPILGICYGMQIIMNQLGGKTEKSKECEFGSIQVEITKKSSLLLKNIYDSFNSQGNPLLNVWMSHMDKVIIIPKEFDIVAQTKNCPFAIVEHKKKKIYGLQFHPEVTHTLQGKKILQRFIYNICNCHPSLWTSDKIIDNIVINIRKKVKQDKVILGLSGGVDSSVSAILLNHAIGKQLTCIFINNGLMRINEADSILSILKNKFKLKIIYIHAEKKFLQALSNVEDPEKKRKIIGNIFIEIFEETAKKSIEDIKWLAQGTIYPDVIESSSSQKDIYSYTSTIKSHHNVGGLPKKMNLKLIEPLRYLFKDEVRKIGLTLGLSKEIIYRHPFPGPGLGVRILGTIRKEYCDILRQADHILIEELFNADLYYKVSQAFTVFLPIKSVGIKGDNRHHEWIIALRIVESVDFMTAKWISLPYSFLDHVSNRIVNEIRGISRVVYDITNKPPATIEWE
ncbi:glutamine-hydrolyzing GMP synthase [Candidatus Tachikawaea gelatinosa]|uniref:GMP synthase [glutamine-hydrolyzing] n=1 Tax=Candidatus Tachikawaea gelatinosa TaxID=1410383 RepID=A0A090BWB7_9ENTR|nr:glutamine-hydrolyzing GMP synthase [Candidatus Tachikawaea gelatinosa]BAP58326.1 GMP synthase [glutamine-hydrolyzing] [Candidatus Tachikawaea gelatinosa]